VVAWEGRNVQGLDKIGRGDKLYVLGRLRYQKYTGQDGVERTQTDIVAYKLALLDDAEQLVAEM
jgi:single-strand DNA-binding protein